jgi:hypothetical protein
MTVAAIANAEAAVLAEAARWVGHQEVPRGSNRSWAIDYWLRETRVDVGLAWCAAWAWNVGRQALGTAWPVPRAALVQAIVDWADARQLLHEQPRFGDLFVLFFPDPLHRYAHIGFVDAPDATGTKFTTLEGNTDPGGGREGYCVSRRTRTVGPRIRFVRWVAALPGGLD